MITSNVIIFKIECYNHKRKISANSAILRNDEINIENDICLAIVNTVCSVQKWL